MTVSLTPQRFFTVPAFPFSDGWKDAEDWLSEPVAQGGLSISEDEKHVFVEAAIPGIDPKDVEITYQDGVVWIHGEVREEEHDKKRKYYRHASRSFSYRVSVPSDINQSADPEATYKHGIMTVTFEKSPKVLPKKISVKQTE